MTLKIKELTKYQRDLLCVTGRVETYINHPERETYPVSCTNYRYDNDLGNALKYLSKALRGGAGININLADYVQPNKPVITKQWEYEISKSHADYDANYDSPTSSLVDASSEYIKIITVADSMEESDQNCVSIEDSWIIFYESLVNLYSVYVKLSNLRASGTTNDKGLTASGPYTFLKFYESLYIYYKEPSLTNIIKLFGTLNECIRRGGVYKNGIITFSYPSYGSYVDEYLDIPLEDIPGSGKKKLIVNNNLLTQDKQFFDMLAEKVNSNNIMLVKERLDKEGKPLEINVCNGIYFRERGTCLLNHVNLGMCLTPKDIVDAFRLGMNLLVDLHFKWKRPDQYLSANDDKQVALGVVGLANFLSFHNISYLEFTEGLKNRANGVPAESLEANKWIDSLFQGYSVATEIAKNWGIERAFTIEPTQSCAYRHTDLLGNTVCRNIYPPHHNVVKRRGHTVKELSKTYHHGLVETVPDVLEDSHKNNINILQTLCESWQKMMDNTGLSHCISYDIYEPVTGDWILNFIENSPLWTTYYVRTGEIDMSVMDKGMCSINKDDKEDCTACSE